MLWGADYNAPKVLHLWGVSNTPVLPALVEMAFLSLVALLVAFGALSKAGRLGGELKILRREVDWLRSDRIRRSGREDAGDAVREVALDAPVPEPEPVDPAISGLGPFSDLVGAELRWRAPPGSSAPFKTGPDGVPLTVEGGGSGESPC